jgi:hypothetical protein
MARFRLLADHAQLDALRPAERRFPIFGGLGQTSSVGTRSAAGSTGFLDNSSSNAVARLMNQRLI